MQATVHTLTQAPAELPKPRSNVLSSFREIIRQQHEMDEIMDLLKRIGRGWVEEIRRQLQQALDHQTGVANRKFEELAERIDKESNSTVQRFEKLAERVDNESNSTVRRFEELAEQLSQNDKSRSLIGERSYDALR